MRISYDAHIMVNAIITVLCKLKFVEGVGLSMVLGSFHSRAIVLVLMIVGHGLNALVGGYLNIVLWHILLSFLFLSFWETARYKLEYSLKEPLKSREENPQKLTQLRSHPRHLVGKKTAQKDTIIDITSDSQVNSNFQNR